MHYHVPFLTAIGRLRSRLGGLGLDGSGVGDSVCGGETEFGSSIIISSLLTPQTMRSK